MAIELSVVAYCPACLFHVDAQALRCARCGCAFQGPNAKAPQRISVRDGVPVPGTDVEGVGAVFDLSDAIDDVDEDDSID